MTKSRDFKTVTSHSVTSLNPTAITTQLNNFSDKGFEMQIITHSKKVLSFNPPVWNCYVLPALPGYSSFPAQSKDMLVRLTGDSRF